MIKLLSSAVTKKLKLSRLPKFLQNKRTREHDEMIVQIKELQVTASTYLSRLQSDSSSDMNEYTSHASQTEEIVSKYKVSIYIIYLSN